LIPFDYKSAQGQFFKRKARHQLRAYVCMRQMFLGANSNKAPIFP
jgi:hypothetical protein